MNRRKSEPRHPASVFFAIILGLSIASAGGVLHAFYKNRQIQVARQIDAIERRIEQYQLDVRTTQYRRASGGKFLLLATDSTRSD
jgi:predicted outer membrane lipoprotein